MNLRTLPALGAAALSAVFGPVAVAGAQASPPSSCGSGPGIASVSVSIDSPGRNATVSGPSVRVRGSASTSLVDLSRVEATLGELRQSTEADAPGPTIPFDFTFDATRLRPGQTSLTVVACGAGSLGGLAWGSATTRVNVEASSEVTTTVAARTGTTTSAKAGAVGPAAASVGSSTTVSPTTKAGQPSPASQTTVASVPPGTEAPGAVSRPEPVRPRAGPDAPLFLTETPANHSPRPPLWVGAAVGVSGGLGLAFSAVSWRRRVRVPELAEPVDPDLVEVG